MKAMRFTPKGYGGQRRDPDQVKSDGWKVRRNRRASGAAKVRRTGLLAVAIDDDHLTWPERELVRQLGEKLYRKLPAVREVRNG